VMLTKLKQLLCRHEFDLPEMGKRKEGSFMLDWPCCKCRKVFTVPFGLAVPGKIINSREPPHDH